jgi:multidrug efflux pump subunit AcrA (membrane-fusion protein)
MNLGKLFLSLTVLTVLMFTVSCGGGGRDRDRGEQAVSVLVEEVSPGRLERYIKLSGELVARDSVQIYPDVPGKIADILKLEGTYVRKGEPIMYVDRFQVGASYALSPVVSPINGYVTRLFVNRGANIAPSIAVATVGNIYEIDAHLNIPERMINEIQRGQKVFITVPAFPNETFEGNIYRMDYAVDSMSHTLLVRASVDNRNRRLLPGMYADVSIFIEAADNVIVLPNTALLEQDGDTLVYMNVSNRAVLRRVETLFSAGDRVAIAEGIEAGEEIVTFGQQFLKEGSKINPIRQAIGMQTSATNKEGE